MNGTRRRPVFVGCLFACAGAIALESVLLGQGVVRSGHERRRLTRKIQERDALARLSPAPTVSTQRATEQDCAAIDQVLVGLRDELAAWESAKPDEGTMTSSPLEAYFAISKFVEETRTRALAKRVGLRPDERFGLASYANEGPAPELVPAVTRQRLVLQELLGALIDAEPQELLTVKRERPVAAGASAPHEDGVVADYLLPVTALAATASDRVRSQSFLVEFSGRTSALRNFLEAVACSGMPLVVRSLEVESLAPGATRERPPAGTPVPVVAERVAKFSVMVDFVELPVVTISSR